MRKFYAIALILFSTLTASAQKVVPYMSVGTSVSSTGDLTAGYEVGKWGIESPFSYALSIYITPKYNDIWVGVKPYLSIADKPTWSVMAYAYPQVNLVNKGMLIEEGVGVNLNLSKKVLLGYYVGAQHSKQTAIAPFVSLSVVLLARK